TWREDVLDQHGFAFDVLSGEIRCRTEPSPRDVDRKTVWTSRRHTVGGTRGRQREGLAVVRERDAPSRARNPLWREVERFPVGVLKIVLSQVLLDPVLCVDVPLGADVASPEGFSGITVLVGDRGQLT